MEFRLDLQGPPLVTGRDKDKHTLGKLEIRNKLHRQVVARYVKESHGR